MKKVILNPKKVKYDGTSFEVVFNKKELLNKFKNLKKQLKRQDIRNESQSKKTTP